MKVLALVVLCSGICSVNCYGPPPKSKKSKSTTTETAPSDDSVYFPGQEPNSVNSPVTPPQNGGAGSYGVGGSSYQIPSGGCAGGLPGSCENSQEQPLKTPQSPQGQQENNPQSPQGQYSNNPQPSYGQHVNSPQPSQGQYSNNPQPSYGQHVNSPPPSQGQYSNNPRPSYGQNVNSPQPSYGQNVNSPQPSQGQYSNNPRPSYGQQSPNNPSSQQPGGNYWWQGPSSPFNSQQQPPSVPSQPSGVISPPHNVGSAGPPHNQNQPGTQPPIPEQTSNYPGSPQNQPTGITPPGQTSNYPGSPQNQPTGITPPGQTSNYPGSPQNQPTGNSPSKPIDIQNNPFLSSALGESKPQAPVNGESPINTNPNYQPISCGSGSTGSCNPVAPPNTPFGAPPQTQQPSQVAPPSYAPNPAGSTPVGSPSKPVDIGNNPYLSSALNNNKPISGCQGSYSGNCGGTQEKPLVNPAPNPAGNAPVGSPSKPVDIDNNPYLSSALNNNKPTSGCQGSYSGNCGGTQEKPGQNQNPTSQQPGQQYPGSSQPGQPQGSQQYPGTSQYPGPQQPGQGSSYNPGFQQPGKPVGSPQYPALQQTGKPLHPGLSQYPGAQPEKPQGNNPNPINQNPGQAVGNPQYVGSQPQTKPQGNQQYPGSSQYPSTHESGRPIWNSQSPDSGYSGQPESKPQYSGSQQTGLGPQYSGNKNPSYQSPGQPQGSQYSPQQPGQQPTVNIPGSKPQYPSYASQGKPSYPQYGNGQTPGQYNPQFSASGPSCNQPGHICVAKSACQQGILTQTGVPGKAGVCNAASEICCRIPTAVTPDKQAPPGISYGTRPGTNGVPIGGSIYDSNPQPTPNSVTSAPTQQPYTGPLNTTPYPGCPAALKCVPISYCTAEGVMSENTVYLTREQQENRVPLTDCMNLETNVQGKCCRDPNYKDPWPAGMMMGKTPAEGGFDDGQYHPPAEQETSGTFSHEAGIYYNVVSSTPKGHTLKKPIGNFNQNPTAFPTKPAIIGSVPVRQPAPVHEKEYPDGVNPPSNEILPPNGDSSSPNPSKPQPAGQYQPSQPNPTGGQTYSPSKPVGTGYQPGQSNTPVSQPGQPSFQPQPANQPLFEPSLVEQQKQPGSIVSSYQPKQPGYSSYQPGPAQTYQPSNQPSSPGNDQPAKGFPIGQPAPGSSCGIRHQAYTSSPEDAGFAEFPWQALVSSASNKTYICGAAIISENAVITAAHCVEELRSKEIVIKAGEWKLLSPSEKPVQVRPAAAVARHPEFSIQTLSHDLAIIVISQPFTFDDHVDKICLPSSPKPTPSGTCVVTGWGRKQLKGLIPGSVLHKVEVTFIPEETCQSKLRTTHLGKYFILNKGFSCALPKSTSDLCKVDVGSPIACDRGDGHYELAGINSWDVGCQTDQTPTISSNPEAEWIEKIINTPTEELAKEEDKYFAQKQKGESLEEVDIGQKPGFALGYGK